MSTLGTVLERIWKSPTERKTYQRIPNEHILDTTEKDRVFEQDKAYFSVNLSEMFLADARRLWQGFAPLTIAVSEFQYGGQKESVPFFVGKDLLRSVDKYLNGQNVEYRNTRILGPVPYSGGNVSLFVGLFRTPLDNLATSLFGVLGDIVGVFDVAGLSSYLKIAKTLSSGLDRLMGFTEMKLLVGARDEFGGAPGDGNRFREGFLAFVNCPEGSLTDHLWTKEGRLLTGARPETAKVLTAYDYCLVKIEHHTERNDYTSLEFHNVWSKARDLIWQGQAEKSRWAFLELLQQVAKSPDLTRGHRSSLLTIYKANFEAEVELYRSTTGIAGETGSQDTMRGGHDTEVSAKSLLDYDAQLSQRAGFTAETVAPLYWTTENWDKIPHLERAAGTELTDDMLSSQVDAMGQLTADPQSLADALVVAAFNRK